MKKNHYAVFYKDSNDEPDKIYIGASSVEDAQSTALEIIDCDETGILAIYECSLDHPKTKDYRVKFTYNNSYGIAAKTIEEARIKARIEIALLILGGTISLEVKEEDLTDWLIPKVYLPNKEEEPDWMKPKPFKKSE